MQSALPFMQQPTPKNTAVKNKKLEVLSKEKDDFMRNVGEDD